MSYADNRGVFSGQGPRVLIVADDLTGALDSAVAFARDGLRVSVVPKLSDLADALAEAPDILSINCDSREASPSDAVKKLEGLAAQLDIERIPVVMKKIDSRLKGNVGVETATLKALSCRTRALAIPAIPDMGRVQQDGFLHGRGIPTPLSLREAFSGDVLVPDARDKAEIDRVVRGLDRATLWVGARAMALALARELLGGAIAPCPTLLGPAFFALGSRDPITLAQSALLAESRRVVEAPNGQVPLLSERADDTPLVVTLTTAQESVPARVAGKRFAEGCARALSLIQPQLLALSGGETASAILQRIGVRSLSVVAEAAPGLPLSTAEAPWGRIQVVTKSGGFGEPDLLAQLARALR